MTDSKTNKSNVAQQNQQMVRVRYEETTASYASQFVLNMSEEEIVINFSSGMMPDPNGENHLPIHTRIAMTPNNATKLAGLLTQALNQRKQGQTSAPSAAAAKLPEMAAANQTNKH